MATWGSQTWGFANWGTLGDISVPVSGQSISTSVGSVQVQQVPGWGTQYWGAGEWGDLKSPEATVTGQELTSTTQTVTAFTDVTVEPTGQQLGPIIIGDYLEGISVEANPLGEELNSTVNSVFAGELVTVPVTSASNEAWGENAWSDGGWGVGDGQTISIGDTSVAIGQQIDAQGEELTVTVNNVLSGISIIGEPAGVELTPDLGSLSFESKYLIGSAQADTDIGNASGLANANVDVTGTQITGATGQLEYEVIYQVTNGSENEVEFTAYNQAQLSTAQAKFGTASLLLDGTNDYVESNSNVDLSSGDFTIDVWIRPSSVSGYKGIWQSGTSTTEQSYLLGSTVYWTVNPSTIISSSVTVNANEWTMLSYERQGNTHRIYKNGTLEDTASNSNKQDNGPFSIGENGFGDFDGYIDEFRLSDTARYGGSSFTEPTGAFVPDSNTTFLLHMDGANGSTNIVDDAPGVTIARFDIGEHFAGEVVEVQVSTASAVPWGYAPFGEGQWGQGVGTDIGIGGEEVAVPSVEVDVTGEELSSNTGDESVTGDANISLTGISLNIQQGDEDAFTNVRVNVSGNEFGPIVIGDYLAGISILVEPTGVTGTTSTGIIGLNAWELIDSGPSPTWTVVDKAA